MATATKGKSKKVASKKAAVKAKKGKTVKKTAKPAAKSGGRPRVDRAALAKKVVDLRDNGGLGWAEISAEAGADQGVCRLVYMQAKVPKSEVISGSDKEVAKAIVQGRDKLNQSWGYLAARSRLPQSKVQKIYTEATGNDWRQGYAAVQARVADAPAKPKKSTAKAKAEKTASAKSRRSAVAKSRKAKKGSANPS